MALVFLVPPWWPVLVVLPFALWGGHALSVAAASRQRHAFGSREQAICGRPVHTRTRALCACAAVVCVALTLLHPAHGDTSGQPVGPDVMICLDVSRSMAARDAGGTRLAAAQQQLQELAAATAATGTRLGLVVFAGDARLVVPLTADLPSVATIAMTFVAGATGRGGSDLGAAIGLGLATLQRAGTAAGCLVLLTDGEDFAGNGVSAAERAHTAAVPVHCFGFGAPGGSKIVVEGDGGASFLRDANGVEVVTRLEVENLTAVAAAGGGRLHREPAAGALLALHDEQLVPMAAAAAVHAGRRAPAHRFQWPLLVALLFWMLRFALPERRR